MRIHLSAVLGLCTILSSVALGSVGTDAGWHLARVGGYQSRSAFEIGSDNVPGIAGLVTYIRRSDSHRNDYNLYPYGIMAREIPLQAWRGKRLRLSLLLKNAGGAAANAMAQIGERDDYILRTRWQRDSGGSALWQANFVLDVPDDANVLTLAVRLDGKGLVWADGVKMEAVGKDIPVTWSERTKASVPSGDGPFQASNWPPEPFWRN